MEECEKVLQLAPDSSLAQSLKQIVQERQELYIRGAVSIITGFFLLWLMTRLTSSGQATLTSLGYFVFCLGIFLWFEGIVVALIGVRAAFLIDGIAVIGVGIANLIVAAASKETLFGVLGAAQLVWGVLGIRAYLKKTGTSYKEIVRQIQGLPKVEDSIRHPTQPDLQKKLDAASRDYAKGKSRKDILPVVEAVLQQDPTLAEAHNLRGMVLEDLHRLDEAAEAYRESLRLEPSFYVAQENLSDLEKRLHRAPASS
jgi:hypothetical protein